MFRADAAGTHIEVNAVIALTVGGSEFVSLFPKSHLFVQK
jgi:hypothetical protein